MGPSECRSADTTRGGGQPRGLSYARSSACPLSKGAVAFILPALALVLVTLLLLMAATTTGCGTTEKAPAQLDAVSLQLNWLHQAEFVGYYVATAKGLYNDHGLDVTILEGGPGKGGRKQVLEGTATFASTTFSVNRDIIKNHQPIVAVMSAFQAPPLVIFSLAKSDIRDPADLVGKRVGVTTDYHSKVLRDTLTAAGQDPDSAVPVTVEPDLQQLYDGGVDAWVGYAFDEAITAQLAGYPVSMIFPSDFGIGGYEGLLVTLQSTATEKPDMVKRFVEASFEGWRYALEHPDEAAAILMTWAPDKGLEFHKKAVRALAPLVDVPDVPVGWIDYARWRQLLGADFDPQQVGYTMGFSPLTP